MGRAKKPQKFAVMKKTTSHKALKQIRPTCDWIQSQVPEVVKNAISHLQDDMDEVDVEALVQAYVNIVVGACISLGLRFAGTRDGNARGLLYNYAFYLLNEAYMFWCL